METTHILALGIGDVLLTVAAFGLIFVLFVGLVVLMILYSRKFMQEYTARLQAFAEQMGLQLVAATGPWYNRTAVHVAGTYRGREVKLDHYITGGKHTKTYQRVEVKPVDSGPGYVSITLEGLGSLIASAVGIKDIQVGDERFDGKFLVKATSDEFARQVLSAPEAREKIIAVTSETRGAIFIQDGAARWSALGLKHSPRVLAVILDALCDMADAADGGVSE